jgi:expansin (peptidoglycan-binding protein)
VCPACYLRLRRDTAPSMTVRVAHLCVSCQSDDIELSIGAFSALGSTAQGSLPVGAWKCAPLSLRLSLWHAQNGTSFSQARRQVAAAAKQEVNGSGSFSVAYALSLPSLSLMTQGGTLWVPC